MCFRLYQCEFLHVKVSQSGWLLTVQTINGTDVCGTSGMAIAALISSLEGRLACPGTGQALCSIGYGPKVGL